jgi:hypothetical protein
MKKLHQLFLLLFLFACSPGGKISITNIHDLAAFQENSFIYALPRTRIRITVLAISHSVVPGPYNAYAEKYLGIKDAISLSKTDWEIKEVHIGTFEEPDPDYYYSLQTNNPAKAINSLVSFSESGLIIDQSKFTPYYLEKEIIEDAPEPLHFEDLSIKRNIESTNVKTKPGTTAKIADVPATKTESKVKSLEQKAEEAANFIIKIRKRRFKLLAGQYEVFPEGIALETSIRELDELESEYLSLFTGKVYSDTVKRVFYYVPRVGQTLERNIFCRFSDELGFQDALSVSGKPLVLELKSLEFTVALRDVQNPYMGPTYNNIIYYRIPDKASARVLYGSTNIVESEIGIYQYGVLVPYSINNFSTD